MKASTTQDMPLASNSIRHPSNIFEPIRQRINFLILVHFLGLQALVKKRKRFETLTLLSGLSSRISVISGSVLPPKSLKQASNRMTVSCIPNFRPLRKYVLSCSIQEFLCFRSKEPKLKRLVKLRFGWGPDAWGSSILEDAASAIRADEDAKGSADIGQSECHIFPVNVKAKSTAASSLPLLIMSITRLQHSPK